MAQHKGQLARIESITVKVTTKDGKSFDVKIDPNEHDSFFWSTEAVDKFVLPYYIATENWEKAVAIRREIEERIAATGLSVIGHKRLCSIDVFDLTEGDPLHG